MKRNSAQNAVEIETAKADRLSRELAALSAKVQELHAERAACLVAAKADGDESAQNRLSKIDEELARSQRDATDCGEVLKIVEKRLAQANEESDREAWERERMDALRILEERSKGALDGRIEGAVNALNMLLEEARVADNEASAVLRSMGLTKEAAEIRNLHLQRSEIICFLLWNEIPIPWHPSYRARLRKANLRTGFVSRIERAARLVEAMEFRNGRPVLDYAQVAG